MLPQGIFTLHKGRLASLNRFTFMNILYGVLGLWVIAVAFLGLTGAALTWTLAITGIVMALIGFFASPAQRDVIHRTT